MIHMSVHVEPLSSIVPFYTSSPAQCYNGLKPRPDCSGPGANLYGFEAEDTLVLPTATLPSLARRLDMAVNVTMVGTATHLLTLLCRGLKLDLLRHD